jgi:hypothetical protein
MEYRRRTSLIGPLILITIGVLFLLANLGILPLAFWEIAARFWPLILILVGLEIIIGRRSMVGALIVVVLWLALIGGVVWLGFAGSGVLPPSAVTTEQLAQPLGDIKSASVALNVGIATTNVTALGSDATDLMKGTFAHSEAIRIIKTYNIVGSEGRLGLTSEGADFAMFDFRNSRWDIRLNPTVPIALSVNGGVGRVNLDLSGLNITALNVDTGVGSISATTPRSGVTTMRVNGGVGSTSITIPNGVGARIRVNGGLGGIRLSESRFPRFGDGYQSGDYASAANKIDINVDGGIGNIGIQ